MTEITKKQQAVRESSKANDRTEITKKQQAVRESSKANDRQVGGDHYKAMGVEPWDVVDTWPCEQRIGYYRGNALKYLMRMDSKDAAPMEVAKCLHYVQKLLEVMDERGDFE